jgi:16S rRNA (uracil1498-N3)-methyltransferase
MKQHRFIGDFNLSKSVIVSYNKELNNQIKNVLRLVIGEQVILSAGDEQEVLAEIENLNKDEVSFKVLEQRKNLAEADNFVTLYCSILKRENFELVVQKATECGVKEIVPIISARTVKTGLKSERLTKIIKEASEQSGRGLVPRLDEAISLSDALKSAKTNDLNLFFDASGEKLTQLVIGKNIGIFIGPEGGWTDKEISLAKEHGCKIVSLGPLILRGETAAIVASYLAVLH